MRTTQWIEAILTALVGVTLLIISLMIISKGLKPFRDLGIIQLASPLTVFGASLIGTLAWQSSSATTLMLVLLMGSGLSLEAGIAGVMAANIATTMTAWFGVAVVGSAGVALALFHLMFNVVSALVWWPFIPRVARLLKSAAG